MATSKRHNRLVGRIYHDILRNFDELVKAEKINPLLEEAALVFWGEKSQEQSLVNIDELDDVGVFVAETINELSYVQPDFLLFKENSYLENVRENRFAGFPDLIVEVWSSGNRADERQLKFELYSTGQNVEHWYLEQNTNIVECYFDRIRLKNQDISDYIATQRGLTFDLRHLAL